MFLIFIQFAAQTRFPSKHKPDFVFRVNYRTPTVQQREFEEFKRRVSFTI